MRALVISLVILAVAALFVLLRTLAARRAGYQLGRHTVVRCQEGHLFTTTWIPGASFKAVRLGMTRYQRCPVDGRMTFISPVRDEDLTDRDRLTAAQHRDTRIP